MKWQFFVSNPEDHHEIAGDNRLCRVHGMASTGRYWKSLKLQLDHSRSNPNNPDKHKQPAPCPQHWPWHEAKPICFRSRPFDKTGQCQRGSVLKRMVHNSPVDLWRHCVLIHGPDTWCVLDHGWWWGLNDASLAVGSEYNPVISTCHKEAGCGTYHYTQVKGRMWYMYWYANNCT